MFAKHVATPFQHASGMSSPKVVCGVATCPWTSPLEAPIPSYRMRLRA